MIDLVALDSLRAVDSRGSVVAAADALGFTPSAVSQQIKRLERQTGVPLLERVGRGVMLTRHGRHLVEQGTRLLSDLEELQSGLHRQAGTVAGHVRLAAFSTAMRGLIAPALPPVLAAHPGLRVSLTEREPWDAVDLVATGQADLAVAHSWGDVPLAVPAHVARVHARERPGRRDRAARPPAGGPGGGHPPRPGGRGLDRHPRGDDLPPVAAADARRDRRAAADRARLDGVRQPPGAGPGRARHRADPAARAGAARPRPGRGGWSTTRCRAARSWPCTGPR